jgi:hypothetical protein
MLRANVCYFCNNFAGTTRTFQFLNVYCYYLITKLFFSIELKLRRKWKYSNQYFCNGTSCIMGKRFYCYHGSACEVVILIVFNLVDLVQFYTISCTELCESCAVRLRTDKQTNRLLVPPVWALIVRWCVCVWNRQCHQMWDGSPRNVRIWTNELACNVFISWWPLDFSLVCLGYEQWS